MSSRIESWGQCSYVSSIVLGESEIERAREVLAAAVDAARGEQLFGADHSERRAELVADQILSAVAAREREIRRLDVPRLGEIGDELRVLVIRMRADHQHARRGAEALRPARPTQRRRAPGQRDAAQRPTADCTQQ